MPPEPVADRVTDRPDRPVVSTRRELGVVAALLAVPVAVLTSGTGDLTLVTLWGLVNPGSFSAPRVVNAYPLWAFFADQPRPFGSLPASIRVWPLAIGFHLLATASAGGGVAIEREDRRVTGGLLVLAATATLWVAAGVAGRLGVGTTAGFLTVLPVGTVATLAVAVGLYGRDLVSAFALDPE